MNAAKTYKEINQLLAVVGESPIPLPAQGTEREKVEALLKTYAARLRQAVPRYRKVKDDRQIVDMGVLYLVKILDGR